MTLRPEDFIECIRYVMRLRKGEGYTDDIDDLGNRRLRTIDELAGDEIRKGFLKLRRTVQERMSLKDPKDLTPRTLVNSKSVSSSIEFFFGRSELSQVVDQTNPLAQLANERRLSALGPGGLNRKRAGFEVRDVHVSHYGRICPIETPEGTNIGLIAQLGIYATVDPYGFLITPYRKVERGKVNGEVRYMRADEEMQHTLAPADIPVDANGRIATDAVVARVKGDFRRIRVEEVEYVDISPKQLVGVSASLIPFLEHDDANRALMGSNMQRQAVPLLAPKPPVVATGMERPVAENSGMVVRTKEAGEVTYVDSSRIVVKNRDGWETEYVLRKFVGLNERTCLNQKPIVQLGQKVKRNQVLADGPGTSEGELALGRDVTCAFMTYDGYNFEDAILVSETLLKDDRFTSIHIDEYEVEVRETKLGREEFTRDIPNVSERQLRNLDELGIIRIGTRVEPGDLLVGKVSPKSKAELSPEEKLLHAIFGRAGEDVKNDSLVVPAGTEGIVISAEKYSRVAHLSDQERRRRGREAKKIEKEMNDRIFAAFRALVETLNSVLRTKIADPVTGAEYGQPRDEAVLLEQIDKFDYEKLETRSQSFDEGREICRREWPKIQELVDEKERQVARLKRGDELPTGVLEMVKVWIATKRTLAVGDKMAGRHGNKGVIARILPVEDMPFMPDGRPVEILLNPLGVPSRMNVGQILETHLGWAAAVLGFQALTPVFDGCKEDTIHDLLEEAGLPRDGKTVLYDGRTGEAFDQRVTVGHIYMMKLHHLVDDKVHARATGPYSLITQQPLGGKARSGGQRFGEMEVWALEAYGAAYILQELLTVKSDDVEGRTKIYESMVMGRNTLEAGTPVSFDVLCNEIKGLCLNIQLEKKRL
jgi:DNA-directed RNA polymerase subunit beta